MKRPRVLRCHFPLKVMFMESVVQHLPELGFDGIILLKSISEKKVWKKTSYNHHFSDNAILNSKLMENIVRWREIVHDNTLAFSGIAEQIAN